MTVGRPVFPVTPSPLEPKVEHRYEIHGDPDEIAAGAGGIGVKRANGMVDRIDPATNEIVFSVEAMTTQGEGGESCSCRESARETLPEDAIPGAGRRGRA